MFERGESITCPLPTSGEELSIEIEGTDLGGLGDNTPWGQPEAEDGYDMFILICFDQDSEGFSSPPSLNILQRIYLTSRGIYY